MRYLFKYFYYTLYVCIQLRLCLLISLKPLFLYVHRFIPAFSSSNSSVRSYGWSYNGAKISHIPGICFLQNGLFWFGAKYRKMWLKQRKSRYCFNVGTLYCSAEDLICFGRIYSSFIYLTFSRRFIQ